MPFFFLQSEGAAREQLRHELRSQVAVPFSPDLALLLPTLRPSPPLADLPAAAGKRLETCVTRRSYASRSTSMACATSCASACSSGSTWCGRTHVCTLSATLSHVHQQKHTHMHKINIQTSAWCGRARTHTHTHTHTRPPTHSHALTLTHTTHR